MESETKHYILSMLQVVILPLSTLAICLFLVHQITMASTLSIEDPPMQGQILNLTADEMDRDLTINPDSNFTETQELPTEGATDIDINEIPPVGVSVIISNESVIVTKEPVTVG